MAKSDVITKPITREIIENFADEINRRKDRGPKPLIRYK